MKYRSHTSYSQIYAGDKQGYNLGLDGAIYLRKEAVGRTFELPRIGTQGKSTSAASASTNIAAGPDTSLNVNLDGTGALLVTLTLAGLTTGILIADALETAINNAYTAAGRDNRCWVEFLSGGPDKYVIHSQYTGATSSVVVTPAASNSIADELKLGVAATGVEVAGLDDQDFLLYTTGGPTFNQPIESNTHRSGRFHAGIIRKKKMAEFNFNTFVNIGTAPGTPAIDTAIRLLWEQLLGKETVNAGTSIVYEQGLPNFTFSLARVSTIFGEYFTGAYVKENTVEFPGDGPATCAWQGKASTRAIAGLAQVLSPVTVSAVVPVQATEAQRYSAGSHVMLVHTDGRTIVAGADGSLSVSSINLGTDELTLSSPVSVAASGYVVPWNPGAVQQTAHDNIFTDLEGQFKFSSGGPRTDITHASLHIVNDHNDLDGYFGRDANQGFVAGNRMTATLSVTFDLSNENFSQVVQSSTFAGYAPVVQLGAASGRRLEITAPKWIPSVPSIEVPENGTTPVTLEGILYQSAPGAQDPLKVSFL